MQNYDGENLSGSLSARDRQIMAMLTGAEAPVFDSFKRPAAVEGSAVDRLNKSNERSEALRKAEEAAWFQNVMKDFGSFVESTVIFQAIAKFNLPQ